MMHCQKNQLKTVTSHAFSTSHAMICSHYVEGKFAILCNLPHPPVTKIGEHSYMSVRHMLADFMAFSNTFDDSWDEFNANLSVSSLPGSFQGQCSKAEAQRVNNYLPMLPVMLLKWSDDFEPNSMSKANREGVWCCTVTFCSRSTNRNNTYLVSLAHKDSKHDAVESAFNQELLDLSAGGISM